MYKSESVQENKMHKILLDFEIQTDYQNFGHMTRHVINQNE